MKRFIAITLALTLLLSQAAVAINIPWLVKNYPDKHFDLSVEPNRVATVEEFIAIVSVYSYFSKGVDNAALWTDKNGRTPSKWCARYVKAEMDKGLFEPSEIAYDAPVTVAFAAKYLSGCKGKYHWDFENEYSFQNTSSLSAEERMYLNVAVDNKLIPYRTNMNAMMQIKRADLLKYLIPAGTLPNVKSPKVTPNNSMKELHAYFADSYWEDEKAYAQLDELKKHADDFTMVSFHAAYLGDSSALVTTNYDRAPFKDAIAFCNDNGILPLMSITNFVNGDYNSANVQNMLDADGEMNAAINAIMADIHKYNLAGINVNFEFVAPLYRDKYVGFLTLLGTRLHSEGKLLLTSIGAYFKDYDQKTSFYDYTKIGQISDYVHIILYDDFSDTAYNYGLVDKPGEMSNFVRINRTLKYATKLIAPDKILLGMASSGVDFNTDTHKAVDGRRPDLVAKGAGKITETKDAMGGTYSYADESGNHVVYFETDEGVRARLLTMYRYNLGGASYFYLGSPHDTIPNTATQFSVYKPEILNAIRANLVPIKYRSFYNTPIRRAEFCDLIAAFIEAKTGAPINDYLTQKGVKVNANAFKDTKNANVLAANALGIVTGKGNGTFGLGTITRQEAAAMLTRLAKCFSYKPTSAPINFTEVAKLDNWASDSIKYISSISDPTNNKRVMNGTGNGRFSPYGSYTREQSYMTLIRLFHVLSQ